MNVGVALVVDLDASEWALILVLAAILEWDPGPGWKLWGLGSCCKWVGAFVLVLGCNE